MKRRRGDAKGGEEVPGDGEERGGCERERGGWTEQGRSTDEDKPTEGGGRTPMVVCLGEERNGSKAETASGGEKKADLDVRCNELCQQQ
eukprot:761643-Hanusia_phi.AAC.2